MSNQQIPSQESSPKSTGTLPIKRKSLRRKLSSYLAIFLTSLLCLLAILYSSPWGTQATIALLNKFTDISLIYKSGMFSEDLEFTEFSYQNDKVDIKASDLSLKFHLRCLWQKQFCINELVAEKLSITTKPSEISTEERTPVEMPLAIKADRVFIKNTQVFLSNQTIEVINLTSAVDIKGNVFAFNSPIADTTIITSVESKEVLPNTANTSKAENETSDQIIDQVNSHTGTQPSVQASTEKNVQANTKNTSENGNTKKLILTDIDLPISLQIKNLSIETLVNHSSLFAFLPVQLNQTKLNAKWFGHDLLISALSSKYAGGIIDINGKMSFINDYPLDFKLNHQLTDNNYWPEVNQSKQLVSLKGDLAQLNITLESEGSIELEGNGSINALTNNSPYSIKLEASKIPLYNQVSQHLHPSKLLLTSKGDINNQTIYLNSIISGLGYKQAQVSIKFDHTQSQSSKDNTEDFELEDVFTFEEVKINDENNNLDLTGKISLGVMPAWNVKVKSSGFTLPKFKGIDNDLIKEWLPASVEKLIAGKFSGRIKGNVDSVGFYNKENSEVSLTNTNLSGLINNIPFSIKGEVDLNENLQLKPSDLTVSVYDSVIKVSGYSDTEWNIKGTLEVPKINKFQSDINGKIATQFDVSGPLNNPTLNFSNKITNLYFKQLSSSLISFQGSYSPLNKHDINAQIKGKEIRWLNTELENFVGRIDADMLQQNLDIKWDGDFKSKLLLNSRLNEKTNNWTGIIAGAEFNYLTNHWQPDTDIIIGYNPSNKKLSLNKHCWNNPGLSICLTKDVSFFEKGNIPLFINLNSYYFNDTFAPEDISVNTSIKGNGSISWAPNKSFSVEGDLAVLAGNILLEPEENYLPVKVLSAWDTGRLAFKVSDNSVFTDLTLNPDSVSRANKNYDFYSDINLKSNMKFTGDFPLSAQLDVDNFSLRPFQSMNHDLALLEGFLSSQVKITGDLMKPEMVGEVNLSDGRLKIIKSPNILEDVQLKLSLLGTTATIAGNFKIDKDDGLITGDATWLNERKLNLNIEAEKLLILVPPQIEATISPKISMTLTPKKLKISGSVHVPDGILRVTKLPEGSVEVTNDVIFVDYQGDEIFKERPFSIDSDINVVINEQFQLTGQGFDGNLEGSLRVQHNNQQPIQIFGNLNIPNGRYQAYGQRLYIDKGKIAFNGPIENPNVDLRATRTIPKENLKVGIEITGLANALSLNLFSTQSLSRAQTLSYLLRGQALESDSADNSGIGVALGAALANYSGILKQIDKLPLINNVEIDGDSTQVSIAGYLGKRIYLKYGIGVDDPVNELTVRLFLMSRLWVETISGLESSADIYYSFDTNL
ncbi:translocation/assembly module TamB domain-containing protein [Pseudocolwellia sp. HL-MZ19]|uniref:translocation/assembly module TamB domain-containing protein n=1 Tax=Pseudocolwellia sp. HL-MZ19 TaxID=3400846 RepID=UPI003CEBA0B5